MKLSSAQYDALWGLVNGNIHNQYDVKENVLKGMLRKGFVTLAYTGEFINPIIVTDAGLAALAHEPADRRRTRGTNEEEATNHG